MTEYDKRIKGNISSDIMTLLVVITVTVLVAIFWIYVIGFLFPEWDTLLRTLGFVASISFIGALVIYIRNDGNFNDR